MDKEELLSNARGHGLLETGDRLCAGKGCPNRGTVELRIIFIQKTGLFCESCAQNLKYYGLVEVEKN